MNVRYSWNQTSEGTHPQRDIAFFVRLWRVSPVRLNHNQRLVYLGLHPNQLRTAQQFLTPVRSDRAQERGADKYNETTPRAENLIMLNPVPAYHETTSSVTAKNRSTGKQAKELVHSSAKPVAPSGLPTSRGVKQQVGYSYL